MNKPTVTIIGFGRVGQAFYRTLPKAGYQVVSVFSKSPHNISVFETGFPTKKDQLGELILLTVPDDEIEAISTKLSDAFSSFEGKKIVHCSGTISSDILIALKEKKAAIASFHPIQAISIDTDSFDSTWFDVEGDEEAIEYFASLCKELGANILPISKSAKPYLHVAAVVASNYLVTLMKIAEEIAEIGGIDKAQTMSAMLPLMQSAINNIEANGTQNSLTGPISRGDVKTVQNHIDILQKQEQLLALYKALGLATVDLSKAPDESLQEIKKLLQ